MSLCGMIIDCANTEIILHLKTLLNIIFIPLLLCTFNATL